MVEYVLLGKRVAFDDPSERFFDLQYAGWQAEQEMQQRFNAWYDSCGKIENVLQGYLNVARKLIQDAVSRPLYESLAQYGIYDVSGDVYWQCCADFSEAEAALRSVSGKVNAIEGKKEAEEEYRAARKAGRGRWQGGGFGFSGAVKGAAMAGGMNLLSGMAHSAVNAVGNAGSSITASGEKRALYGRAETREILFDGLSEALLSFFDAHIVLVNERRPGCIRSGFDPDRSEALLENAKKLPDKRVELLVQAVQLWPWNVELLKYIFVNFPKERAAVSAIAQRFRVDLSDTYEAILEREYTEKDRETEEAAQRAKGRIRKLMQEYGIPVSATLDRLENDCLARLCGGYETAGREACLAMVRAVERYDALEKNKAPYLEKLRQRISAIWEEEMDAICAGYEQADEAACNDRKRAIQEYDAPDEAKEPFFQKLQKRIEEIWSEEDSKAFDQLYLATDITDPAAVAETLNRIKERARTSSSEQYITALNACTPKNIEKARIYRRGRRPKIYTAAGLLFLFLALSALFILHLGLPAGICCIAASIVFLMLYTGLYQLWKELTIDGAVVHPVLTKDLPQPKKGVPAALIALLAAAVLTVAAQLILRGVAEGANPGAAGDIPSAAVETETVEDEALETAYPSPEPVPEEPVASQTPELAISASPDSDVSGFDRYLGEDYQVYWNDGTLDQTGTEEFQAICPDGTDLAGIFDGAITLGIDASRYLSAHENDPGTTDASDSSGGEELPPQITQEDILAALSQALPEAVGTGNGESITTQADDADPMTVHALVGEIRSADPDLYDTSAMTAELTLYWTGAGWDCTGVQLSGDLLLETAGSYTVWNYGQTQSIDVEIGPSAWIDTGGSLVLRDVAITRNGETTNVSMSVERLDNPAGMAATSETGSVYLAYSEEAGVHLYFGRDMVPTIFSPEF